MFGLLFGKRIPCNFIFPSRLINETKSIKLYVMCGYSASDFLIVWEQHVSDCGDAAYVHTDKGTNLVAAANELDEVDELAASAWDEIAAKTNPDTVWRQCPAGAQFRNGATEAVVKKLKRSLLMNLCTFMIPETPN